ncbi:MAG: hypothetical protein AB8B69_15675 [Chitinophagales bacterium]
MPPTFLDKIEPTFVALSADLPKHTVLNEQRILGFIRVRLKTSTLTTISLSLTGEGIQIHFSPSIDIEVMDTIRVKWDRVYYDFGQAKITAIDLTNNFWGKIVEKSLRNQLTSMSLKLFENTPLKKRAYHPIKDSSIKKTLQQLQQNAEKLGKSFVNKTSSPSLELKNFKNVEVGLSLLSKETLQVATTQGAIVVPSSGQVAASIRFAGNAADLMIEEKRKIKHIQFYSENDVLLYSVDKNAELQSALAIMQVVEIAPKGKVSLQQWLPLGIIKKASNVESALKLLRVMLLLDNIPPEALRKLANHPKPTESEIVKGITKITIDDALTAAFIETAKTNCEPIEGINVCFLLNLE